MATKEQCEFFRGLYAEEERSSAQLESRAKVYLSIITAFLVTLLFQSRGEPDGTTALGIPGVALALVATVLAASLCLVVYAIMIRTYEATTDGVDIINGYGETLPSDEEFFEDRIADYAVASSRNRTVNNRVAAILSGAGVCIAIASLLLFLLIAISLGGVL